MTVIVIIDDSQMNILMMRKALSSSLIASQDVV